MSHSDQPAGLQKFAASASVSTSAGTAAPPDEAVKGDAGQGQSDRILALARLALDKNRRQRESRAKTDLPQ